MHVLELQDPLTRLQLHHESNVSDMAFWLRGQGYKVRYYQTEEPVSLDTHEVSRAINLIRDYSHYRRWFR